MGFVGKKWTALVIGLLIVVVAGVTVLIFSRGSNDANQVNVYFFNPEVMRLEAEARPLGVGNFQIHEVIRHLHSGPVRSAALVNMWPFMLAPQPEDLISYVELEGSTLLAFFSPVFHEMSPLDQSLFKAAFIHTMMGLPSVTEIKITVTSDYSHAFEIIMKNLSGDDEYTSSGAYDEYYTPYIPLVIYDSSHAGVLLEPLDPPISPRWIADYTFNYLHFVDATGTGLVVESHFAADIDRWDEPLARYALYLLIAGPSQEGALSLIPPETRVLDLEIVDSDVYLNLSSDFVTRFANPELADLMIQSIVNTLIAELRAPTRVFFLIETQLLEQFHGIEDFHHGFTRDNTLLLSYIEARAEEYEQDAEETE